MVNNGCGQLHTSCNAEKQSKTKVSQRPDDLYLVNEHHLILTISVRADGVYTTTRIVLSPDPLDSAIGGGVGEGGAKMTGEGLANRVHLPQAEAQIPCKVLVSNLVHSYTALI